MLKIGQKAKPFLLNQVKSGRSWGFLKRNY